MYPAPRSRRRSKDLAIKPKAKKGVCSSRAVGHYLSIAQETLREREGVPGGRADELLEVIDGLRARVDILGPPTFGMLRLLAHWSTHGGE
jgi:hypothetical protein